MKGALIISSCLVVSCFGQQNTAPSPVALKNEIAETLRPNIIKKAAWALQQQPITVTASSSPRSAGGKHDFFSEGDYWWPNPASPDSPYIQRDGMTNPDNFVAHRHAMIRLSQIVGALASAICIDTSGKIRHSGSETLPCMVCRYGFNDESKFIVWPGDQRPCNRPGNRDH